MQAWINKPELVLAWINTSEGINVFRQHSRLLTVKQVILNQLTAAIGL